MCVCVCVCVYNVFINECSFTNTNAGCPDHPALSSSGGISVTVLPLSGVTEVETARYM